MRKLYIHFPKSETLSNVLSWSHYFEILRSDNDLEINFYTKQTINENWSVRELKRQMKSMLFHRLALSKDNILVEYATENIGNQLFVSKYQLYLPDKKQFENQLNKLLDGE